MSFPPEHGLLVSFAEPHCYGSAMQGRIVTSVETVRAKKRAMGLRPTEIWFTSKQIDAIAEEAKREGGAVRDQMVRVLVDEALERRAMTRNNTPER